MRRRNRVGSRFVVGVVIVIVLCILSAVLNLVVELTTKPEGGESK